MSMTLNGTTGGRLVDPSRSGIDRVIALVAVALLIGFGVVWSWNTEVAGGDVVRFALYYLLALTVPGTIVLKACLGTRHSWLADLVWGTINGLCLELFAWGLFSLLGFQSWLRFWPLLVLVLLVSPVSRARILERPVQFGPTWLVVGGSIVALSLWQRVWWPFTLNYELPPHSRPHYVDIPWQMGLAWEATRGIPLLTPQMADAGPLKYSWFVHAHLGSASLIAGIDVPTLVLRLWAAPMMALVVFGVGLLAHRVSGQVLAGVAAMALYGSQGQFDFWHKIFGSSNYVPPLSPTTIFTVVVSVFTIWLAAEILSGKTPRLAWLLLAMAAIVSAGSKSSTMVVLTAAVLGTLIVALLLRSRRKELLIMSGCAVTLTVFALALVTGGGDSTRLQLFGALTLLPPFRSLGGDPAFGRRFADDLIHTEGVGAWLLLSLLVGIALRMIVALSPVFVPFLRDLRDDLVAWLLGGIVVAAWLPFLLMSHNGYSQYYFIYGAMPFGAVLWGWIVAIVVGHHRRRSQGFLAAVALGMLLAWFGSMIPKSAWPSTNDQWLRELQTFLLPSLAGVGLLILVGFLGHRFRSRAPWAVGVALGLLLGAMMVPYLTASAPSRPSPVDELVAARSLAEGEAALWIQDNVGLYDLMATNSACTNEAESCNTKRWWISGLGGRRVFVEGWGYTPDGADGRVDSSNSPDVNFAAFARPSDETIGAIMDRGVEWMVVESLGEQFPEPDLSRWGDLAYKNDLVEIYRLRD